jgi:hypothetical protein
MPSSGMLRRMDLVRTEEPIASIREAKSGELGTNVNSN